MAKNIVLVCDDGQQFALAIDGDVRETLTRAAGTGDNPALQNFLSSGTTVEPPQAGKNAAAQRQPTAQTLALKLEGTKAETAADLIEYFRSKRLPEESERLKPLYLLSARLQLLSLRDSIETAIADEAALAATPKVGLTLEEYRSGKWKGLYQRPEAVDQAAELVSSTATGGPLSEHISLDFEERRRRRELAASLTALPDPFGIREEARRMRLSAGSALGSETNSAAAGGTS
jgi:hypothetical protein